MDYQVPQFIEVEDKIFGPLTLKQFIYIAGGVGICTVIVLYVPILVLAIILCLPIAGLSAALAFYKVNNKPFIEVLEAGFNYYIGRRLYLWRKEKEETPSNETKIVTEAEAPVQKLGLSQKKLSELAWSLDVKNTGKEEAL
jgi:PrgI family protein